jgi:hypothetical protein
MIKYVITFDVADLTHFDEWLFSQHSTECVHYFGPWLRRYESYRAYDAPAEADAFGVRRGRLTELWFDSVEDFIEAKPLQRPLTPYEPAAPENGVEAAALAIVSAMPTDDFLQTEPPLSVEPIVRWCTFFGYPEGVSMEEGDDWYVNTHAQEAKSAPGLLRYISHRQPEASPLPTPFQRFTEIWFESIDHWKSAVVDSAFLANMTPPPWDPALGNMHTACTFVPREPDADFLK